MKKIIRSIVALTIVAVMFGTFGNMKAQAADDVQYDLVIANSVEDVELIKQNAFMLPDKAIEYLQSLLPVGNAGDIVWCVYYDDFIGQNYCYYKYTTGWNTFGAANEYQLENMFASATCNYLLAVDNPAMGQSVTLTVNKDGAEYIGHNKTFKLYQDGTEKYVGTGTNGTVTFSSLIAGTYDLYDSGTDTDMDVIVSSDEPSPIINYYTVEYAVSNLGNASGSTISATYNNTVIPTNTVVLGGKQLVITVTGAGADSYNYAWAGAGTSSETVATVTKPILSGKVNATCTVTGINAYTLTVNAGTGGTVSGSTTLAEGTTTTITATADENYTFSGWTSSNGGTFGDANSASTTFTMPSANTTVTANFTANNIITIEVLEVEVAVLDGLENYIKANANVENAFSQSVEIRLSDSEETTNEFTTLLGDNNGKILAFDISLYIKGTNQKTQPQNGYAVTISIPLPNELWDSRADIQIAHILDGKVQILPSNLVWENEMWNIVFDAEHFSPYALLVGVKEPETSTTTPETSTTTPEVITSPKTSDSMLTIWLLMVAMASGISCVVFGRKKRISEK